MSQRDRLVVVIVVAVVAVVGSWILVIGPKRDQASKLAAKVTAAQKQLATARTEIATADLDRSAYERNYEAVAELGEAVPTADDSPALIFQLQNAASRAGVDFLSMALSGASSTSAAPPSTTSTTTSTTQPITISFQGNFFHLANFLGRIERFVVATDKKVSVSGRLMTLNGVSFAAASSGFPQITATITATTYLLPANESLTQAGSSGGIASGAQTVSGTASSPTPAATITP